MFKVTKKPKTSNVLWNADDNRPLCRFVNGAFETDDENLALKLKDLGYAVEGEVEARPLDKMKIDELKAYAAERGIDLGEAANKADILQIIQSFDR